MSLAASMLVGLALGGLLVLVTGCLFLGVVLLLGRGGDN